MYSYQTYPVELFATRKLFYLFCILSVLLNCCAQLLNETSVIEGPANSLQSCVVSVQLVSLRRNICAGVLVGRKHVLTTAYCANITLTTLKELHVVAGVHDSRNWGPYVQTSQILRSLVHPREGKRTTRDYIFDNIGLLLLVQSIAESLSVSYARQIGAPVYEGSLVKVFSWERKLDNKISTYSLQFFDLKATNHSNCASGDKDKVLYSSECGLEFRTGESGSPVFQGNILVALRSNANTYVRLSFYKKWIHSTLQNKNLAWNSILKYNRRGGWIISGTRQILNLKRFMLLLLLLNVLKHFI